MSMLRISANQLGSNQPSFMLGKAEPGMFAANTFASGHSSNKVTGQPGSNNSMYSQHSSMVPSPKKNQPYQVTQFKAATVTQHTMAGSIDNQENYPFNGTQKHR